MVLFFLGTFLTVEDARANEAHQILSGQSNQERNETLTVLLQHSSEDCDVVVTNFFQGLEPEGGALWNVTCENGKSFVILIGEGGIGAFEL